MATTALRAGERVPLRAYADRYLGPGQPWWRQTWNALVQPLLAPSFAGFWRSWNPVQGYYLRWWCYRPARRVLPRPAAVLVTFTASGLVHNLIAVALSRRINPFVTVWFVLYGRSRWSAARRGDLDALRALVVVPSPWRRSCSCTTSASAGPG